MPNILPYLWFGDGRAEEAAEFYVSIFPNSRIVDVSRYGDKGPMPAGSVMVVEFELDGQPWKALNGPPVGDGGVSEFRGGISLYVDCESQEELDRYWDALLVAGKKMPCGWVIDRYGFSWNLVPRGLSNYLAGDDEEGAERALKAMLAMHKIDLSEIQAAYEGRT
jgi:predicted 3-demethylubiquinone-9 3-methyltransferase (glyoxalase superfamily)